MSIHRGWRLGMAAGAMLVSGGCVADAITAPVAPTPQVSTGEAQMDSAHEVAGPGEAIDRSHARIFVCRLGVSQPDGPTYIVDGKVVLKRDFQEMDRRRIDSIEILRGPCAAALDGSRAVDGVVLIRTRDGRGAR